MDHSLQGRSFGLEVDPEGRFLVVRLFGAHRALSSTLVGGGEHTVDCITWSLGTSLELNQDVDASDWLQGRVREAGCDPARTAAFITSRRLHAFVIETSPCEEGSVAVIATAGAGNALRVGDPADSESWHAGTINLAVILPCQMTPSAMVEVVALATEARTVAVRDSGLRSIVSGLPATGTGTDAVAVVAPLGRRRSAIKAKDFAGKHTSIGSAVGQAARRAVRRALKDWIAECEEAGLPTLCQAPGFAAAGASGASVVLVGGGVRSGKSAFAEARTLALAQRAGSKPVYVATAQAYDDEMRLRIERHQAERGECFASIEEPLRLAAALKAIMDGSHAELECQEGEAPGAVLVDCLTLWLSNLLCEGHDDAAVEQRCAALVGVLRNSPVPIVVVSNEVGLGIVPETLMGRRFRDLAGRLHQSLVEVSDEVYLAILGTTLRLIPGPVEQVRR